MQFILVDSLNPKQHVNNTQRLLLHRHSTALAVRLAVVPSAFACSSHALKAPFQRVESTRVATPIVIIDVAGLFALLAVVVTKQAIFLDFVGLLDP